MASRFLNKNTKGPKGDLEKIFLMSKELVGVGSRSKDVISKVQSGESGTLHFILKTFASGADRRCRREKLGISACKTKKNLTF